MLSSSRKKKRNTFSVEIRRHPCGSPTSSPPTKKRSLGDGVIQTTTPNSHAATTNKMDWQSPDSNHAGVALPNSGSFASMLGLDFTPLFSNNTASPRPSMGGGSMTGAAHTPLTISMTPLTGIAHTPLTGAGHGFVSQGLPPTGTTPSQLPPDNRGETVSGLVVPAAAATNQLNSTDPRLENQQVSLSPPPVEVANATLWDLLNLNNEDRRKRSFKQEYHELRLLNGTDPLSQVEELKAAIKSDPLLSLLATLGRSKLQNGKCETLVGTIQQVRKKVDGEAGNGGLKLKHQQFKQQNQALKKPLQQAEAELKQAQQKRDALLQSYREAKTNEEDTYDMIQKEEQKGRQAQALLQLTQSLLNDDLTWRNDDNASVRHRLNLREDKDLARMSFTDSILALHAMDLLQVHECEWFQYGTIQTAKGDASKADMRARIGNYLNFSSSAVIASQLSDEDIKSPAEDTKPPVEDTKPPAKDSKPVCGLDSMNPSDVGNTMQMHPMMHPYFHTGQPIAYPHTAMGVPFVPFGTSSMMAGGYGHMVPAAWSINGDAEFRPQTLFGMMQGTAGTSKHKQKSKKSKAGVKKAPNKAASKKAVRKEAESSFSDSSKEEKRDEEKQIDGYEGERDDSSSSS